MGVFEGGKSARTSECYEPEWAVAIQGGAPMLCWWVSEIDSLWDQPLSYRAFARVPGRAPERSASIRSKALLKRAQI